MVYVDDYPIETSSAGSRPTTGKCNCKVCFNRLCVGGYTHSNRGSLIVEEDIQVEEDILTGDL